MKSRYLLWILTLAMPLLLGWIVVVGQLNRVADRSAGVHASMIASRVDETPFTAPKLKLSDELLESHPAPTHIRSGEDVFLRYIRKEGQWAFDGARKKAGEHTWSSTVVEIPGRVAIGDGGSGLKAEPLLPSSFAVSRSTMSRLHQQTLLDLTLHRGAFDTVWVSEAFESALPLGNVVAILRPPHRSVALAVGNDTETIVRPTDFGSGSNSGWLAPIENDQVGLSTKIEGRPVDAIPFESAIVIAVQQLANRFAVQTGQSQTSHEGAFLSFETDGSFWSLQPDPFPSGQRRKLIKRSRDGTIQQQAVVEATVAGAYGNMAVTTIGYNVRRYTIDRSQLLLSDSWTIEGLTSTCMATPTFIAAAGADGVFILTPGDKSPKKILDRDNQFTTASVRCNRDGDVLAVMRRPEAGFNRSLAVQLILRSANGSLIALGEHPLAVDYRDEAPRGSPFLRVGDKLYVGGSGEIHIFDTNSGRLLRRIIGRRIGERRRVL